MILKELSIFIPVQSYGIEKMPIWCRRQELNQISEDQLRELVEENLVSACSVTNNSWPVETKHFPKVDFAIDVLGQFDAYLSNEFDNSIIIVSGAADSAEY